MKHYLITCTRGHCGVGHSTEIKFAIRAENMISAMDRARHMPSVKHTRIILLGKEISEEEYNEYRQKSAYERYPQHRTQRKKRYG